MIRWNKYLSTTGFNTMEGNTAVALFDLFSINSVMMYQLFFGTKVQRVTHFCLLYRTTPLPNNQG